MVLRQRGASRRLSVIGVFSLMVLLIHGSVSAATSIVEVRESPYFLDHLSRYGGLTVTRGFSPFPVFFEGWKSTPRADILEYEWDFGDGSPKYFGFNAAHVYELAPGATVSATYTATLTIRTRNGEVDTDSIDITVLPRFGSAGKTYYVDSVAGTDTNSGLSQAQPWRTATKAFSGMNTGLFGPGDQILFKRGQTFEVQAGIVLPGHAVSRYGYMFGAFGSGAKPIIQLVGTNTGFIIKHLGVGLGHFAITDLHFKLKSSSGAQASLLTVLGDAENVLLYRVDVEDFSQFFLPNGKQLDNTSGVFVVECTAKNSSWVQMWGLMSRLAILDSEFDDSENHIAYLAYVDRGVITGNTFSRPAFGRTALRLCSSTNDFDYATNNVVVNDNRFLGWIDPIVGGATHADGTRYNWELINLAPNSSAKQRMHDVVFERNIVTNAETLITISDYDDLDVKNNLFIGKSQSVGDRIKIGKPGYDSKPVRNIRIVGNTFLLAGASSGVNPVIGLNAYDGPAYQGVTQHQNVEFKNNIIRQPYGRGRMIFIEENLSSLISALKSENNLYYAPDTGSELFQIGGNFQGGGTKYTIQSWRSTFGKDLNSLVTDPQLLDMVGPDGVFAALYPDEDLHVSDTSPAIDAGLVHPVLNFDFERVSRSNGSAPDIGAYEQTARLTVTIVGQGTVQQNPPPPYQPDQSITLTATPDPKWAFVEWQGDVVSSNPVENITLNGAKTVVAVFQQVEFDLDVQTVGQGSIGVSPAGPYALNDIVDLTATPDPGQQFIRWTGDIIGNSTDVAVQVQMDGDKSVEGKFTKSAYTISVNVLGTGNVDVTPDLATYQYLDDVVLVATPGADMQFWGWTGDVSGSNPVLNLTDIEDDYDITAVFVQDFYTVDVTIAGNGTVVLSPPANGLYYQYQEPITLTATPDPGWEFVDYTGTLSSVDSIYSFDIESNQAITATFEPEMFDVNVNVAGRGSVELSPPGPYAFNDTVTMTAVPDSGWQFSAFHGGIESSQNPYVFAIQSDLNVTAEFVDFGADLTLWYSDGGSVVQDPSPPYEVGADVTLTVNPEPGFRFLGWSGDLSGSDAEVTLTLNQDKTIGAHFGIIKEQVREIVVPMYLDNDGVFTDPDAGTRALISLRNTLDEEADLSVFYRSADGVDRTPANNTFTMPPKWVVQFRPRAVEFSTEGFGVTIPDAMPDPAAGGARLLVDKGALSGVCFNYVHGFLGPQSAYSLPNAEGMETLSVPFFLDNDGVKTDVDKGTRTFIGVQNISDQPTTLTITYKDGPGNDVTPAQNTYVLGPRQSVAWRPYASEAATEGVGFSVPNMTGALPAGSALISSTGPIVGRVVQRTWGPTGSEAAYPLPDGQGAQTVIVPFLLDNDGIKTAVDGGVRSFIGVQNVTDRDVTLVISYAAANGTDITPSSNTFVLGPFQAVSWRPFANEPSFEGAGTTVANATGSQPTGSAKIVAVGGRIVGRIVHQNGGFVGTQSAYLLPSDSDAQTLIVPYFEDNDGVTVASGLGVRTYIGLKNTTPMPLNIDLEYTAEDGSDVTPANHSIVLAPYQAIAWRPVANDPAEGLGIAVPNVGLGVLSGSCRIHSPLGGIVGRVIATRGVGVVPQLAHEMIPEYDVVP